MTGSTLNFRTLFPPLRIASPSPADGLTTECRAWGRLLGPGRPAESCELVRRKASGQEAVDRGVGDELGQTVVGIEFERGLRIVLRHRRSAQGPFVPGDDSIGGGTDLRMPQRKVLLEERDRDED